MPDLLLPYIPIVLLALVLVAPRRGGRPVSYLAKVAAVLVLVVGSIAMTFALLWNHILGL